MLTLVSETWVVARPTLAGANATAEAKREDTIASFIVFEIGRNLCNCFKLNILVSTQTVVLVLYHIVVLLHKSRVTEILASNSIILFFLC